MSKRNEIQKDALNTALRFARAGLGVSMGVGKTLIGLRYLEHFWNAGTMRKALVVAPKLSIFQSWNEDAEKFGVDKDMMNALTFTTYLSLIKHHPDDYDIVVLDECHSLLPTHISFLEPFKGRILGLTGTPPRYSNSPKGELVKRYCPMSYVYITDDAVDDGILNDYRIIVHKMRLSRENNFRVQTRNGGDFYTSEQKNYGYWSERVMLANSKKEEQIASVMRMRALMSYHTKEVYARLLLNEIKDKCIIFCNTQEQADKLCKYSYHSTNSDSEENLEAFKNGVIDQLSCVLQLNEGVNIPHLRAGIIMHAYGNERKSSQRIGRLLRLNPDDTAIVHILCYKDTVDEKWVHEALKDLDPEKIKYVNVDDVKNTNLDEQAFVFLR